MYSRYMKFTKIISGLLALGALLLCMSACQHIPKTQLILFESLSFNMPLKSLEKVFGEADEVIEETETAFRDTWHARDPYFYKTGRLFYHYENFKWKSYSGRVTFTFSESHRLQGASVYFPVASKAQQKEVLYKITQDMKAEIEALPDYQSMTTDTVGLYDDGYRYKVKLKGQKRELWIDVYPTEYEDEDNPENNQYNIRIDQSRLD